MVQRGLNPADYQLIRSRRKTLSVEVGKRGIIIRAPLHVSDAEIRSFVAGHENWIRKHAEEYEKKAGEPEKSPADRLSPQDLRSLADQALTVIPERVAYYAPKVGFRTSDFVSEQVFFTSKDGTRVPMFLTYKKGLKRNGKNPTLVYGYGGFNIGLTPSFSAMRIPFLEKGGIYVMVNLW